MLASTPTQLFRETIMPGCVAKEDPVPSLRVSVPQK
jgi:hypothetical protein